MNPKWHLSYASGYMELGLFAEALAELDKVDGDARTSVEFLGLKATLYQETREWSAMQNVARELCERNPENAGWWIMHAYGARRAESLARAEEILLTAALMHAGDATIQFNLGCYSCQRGDLETARSRVGRAIQLDQRFRELAKSDPDLEALREADGQTSA